MNNFFAWESVDVINGDIVFSSCLVLYAFGPWNQGNVIPSLTFDPKQGTVVDGNGGYCQFSVTFA